MSDGRRINIGSRNLDYEGFENVDVDPQWNPHWCCDIRNMPFENGSVDEVIAHDIFEHFTSGEIHEVMRELDRVTSPGAKVHVRCPELRLVCQLMLGEMAVASPTYMARKIYGDQGTDYDVHKAGYDFITLRKLLFSYGFQKIVSSSVSNFPNYDLVVEKSKPLFEKEHWKILFSSCMRTNYPYDTGIFLVNALKSLGHEVLEWDFMGKDNPSKEEVEEFGPDIAFGWKVIFADPREVMELPCPLVLWYPDDFDLSHARKHIAFPVSFADVVINFSLNNLDLLRTGGFTNSYWVPCGVDLNFYRDKGLNRDLDILFAGTVTPERQEVLEKIKGWGFNVRIEQEVYGEELVNLYNRAKIVFNLGVGPSGHQLRVFEGMACGALVISNRVVPDENLFTHLQDILYYEDEDQLQGYLKKALGDDKFRESIANAGHKAVKEQTWEVRIKEIFTYLKVYMGKKPRRYWEQHNESQVPRS